MITQAELKELLTYDPETGVFRWLVDRCVFKHGRSKGPRAGDVAGHGHAGRYWRISINYRGYYAHRLAFFYMTGEWPADVVDHINGDKFDNRWSNLRQATQGENLRNMRKSKRNQSGFKGVYRHTENDKWVAQIKINGRAKNLGSFKCPTAAHLAYCRAAKIHHGEFARVA
jgi:hypothetical protein